MQVLGMSCAFSPFLTPDWKEKKIKSGAPQVLLMREESRYFFRSFPLTKTVVPAGSY